MIYIVEFFEEESPGVSGRFRAVELECDDENFLPAELAKAGHNFTKIHKYYPKKEKTQ